MNTKTKFNLKFLLLIVTICFLDLANAIAQTNIKDKPNILFIICDDLNDAITGFGGHPQAKTPNLDRLAKQGVRFANAQSNAPVCGPSRASFLTGLYPHSTGYYGHNFHNYHWRYNPVLGRAVTFLDYFRQNDYKVMGTGKIVFY